MNNNEHLEAIKEIRKLMNESVRFLSLSGLSGVVAGSFAIVASILAYLRLKDGEPLNISAEDVYYLLTVGAATLVLSLFSAWFFTRQKAHRDGVKMWDESVKIGLMNLFIPLITGGILCLILIRAGLFVYVAPVCLIFYGLALVSASRHTFPIIKQLGIIEIVLGLISAYHLGYGLIYWAIGFGVIHIIYGTVMYYKFDRQ